MLVEIVIFVALLLVAPRLRLGAGSTRLEIERRKLGVPAPGEQPKTPEEFRAKQLRARELLRGDLEGRDLEEYVERERA